MAHPFVVHQSQIKCFRHCQKQHWYRYVEKIERRRRPQPLIRGTIIHSMVENRANGKDPFDALKAADKQYKKMFDEEREEYGDIIGDIGRLMIAYFEWYKNDPIKPIVISGKAAEHKFSVDLAPGIVLEGKIDRFGKVKDGRVCLEDTKSHKKLPEGDVNYSDLQTMLYAWATPIYFKIKPDCIAWNYIRYKAPTIPGLLKNGELTKRDLDTLWPVYLQEIKKHNLDVRDYQDVKERLEGSEATFFVRSYVPIHKKLIEAVRTEAIQTAQEIKLEKKPVRNIGRHCDWCEYKNLCQAEFRGLDVKFMRKKDYQPKEEKEEVDVE